MNTLQFFCIGGGLVHAGIETIANIGTSPADRIVWQFETFCSRVFDEFSYLPNHQDLVTCLVCFTKNRV